MPAIPTSHQRITTRALAKSKRCPYSLTGNDEKKPEQDQVVVHAGAQQRANLHHYYIDPNAPKATVKQQTALHRPFTSKGSISTIAERPHYRYILKHYGFQVPEDDFKIGEGNYSVVIKGKYNNSSKMCAIKVIDLERISVNFREKFLPRELQCWPKLRHANICKLYQQFRLCNYQFVIMELCQPKNLLSYVQSYGALDELKAGRIMIQVIRGVEYLHARNIAHRDLKLENLLLSVDEPLAVKIADFGFCKQSTDLSTTFCGSKSYSAPEVLSGLVYNMYKADIWSLGVVGFVILTNTMPFNEHVEHVSFIVQAQRSRAYRYPPSVTPSAMCRTAIDAMMTFDATLRPTIRDCLQHLQWIKSIREEVLF